MLDDGVQMSQDVAEAVIPSGHVLVFPRLNASESSSTEKLQRLPDTNELMEANKNKRVWSSESANIDLAEMCLVAENSTFFAPLLLEKKERLNGNAKSFSFGGLLEKLFVLLDVSSADRGRVGGEGLYLSVALPASEPASSLAARRHSCCSKKRGRRTDAHLTPCGVSI